MARAHDPARRPLLKTLLLSSALLVAAAPLHRADAQEYPSRPVRIVVPYTAGGPADALGRLVALKLSEKWGQQVLVDNRPGANTIIGMEHVARSAPDGYTLILATTAMAINAAIVPKIPFDAVKDFTPISNLISTSFLLAVHPTVPARNLGELIAFAKANPGKLTYGSGGSGSPTHVSGELLQSMAGIKLVHVPYKGTATTMVDLVAGHISMMFGDPMALSAHVAQGKVRAIGVTSAKRHPGAPDVPTLSESGLAGFESGTWYGLLGPAGMPKTVVDALHAAVVQVMQQPEIVQRFSSFGTTVVADTPAQFGTLIEADLAKWKKAAANMSAEGAAPAPRQ